MERLRQRQEETLFDLDEADQDQAMAGKPVHEDAQTRLLRRYTAEARRELHWARVELDKARAERAGRRFEIEEQLVRPREITPESLAEIAEMEARQSLPVTGPGLAAVLEPSNEECPEVEAVELAIENDPSRSRSRRGPPCRRGAGRGHADPGGWGGGARHAGSDSCAAAVVGYVAMSASRSLAGTLLPKPAPRNRRERLALEKKAQQDS